jgi:hypothetical protein
MAKIAQWRTAMPAGSSGRGAGESHKERSGSLVTGPTKDQKQAEEERGCETVSKPGGFKNDPDDPTNPNEVRERTLRKLRR